MMLWLRHLYWYVLGVREAFDRVTTGAPSRPLQQSYNRGRRHVRCLTLRDLGNDRIR